jgi:hypothetical protein
MNEDPELDPTAPLVPATEETVSTEVPALLAGVRVDRGVAMVADVSRAVATQLIAAGRVRVTVRPSQWDERCSARARPSRSSCRRSRTGALRRSPTCASRSSTPTPLWP